MSIEENNIRLSSSSSSDQELFSDDVIYEIISFIDCSDYQFLLMTCVLVSKQWMNAVRNLTKLSIIIDRPVDGMTGSLFSYFASVEIRAKIKNERFWDEIGTSNRLNSLVISKNDLSSHEISKITLYNNLTRLMLRHCKIDDEGVSLISQMNHLQELGLPGNRFNIKVLEKIRDMTNLTFLDLSYNRLDANASEVISEMKNLKTLKVNDNNIGVDGLWFIKQLDGLTSLFVASNRFGDEVAQVISEMNNLTLLDISNNEIGSDGAASISKMERLTSLNIGFNPIGPFGAEFVCNIRDLKTLLINNCEIESSGVEYICDMIANNELSVSEPIAQLKNLTLLDISGNDTTIYTDKYNQRINNTTVWH